VGEKRKLMCACECCGRRSKRQQLCAARKATAIESRWEKIITFFCILYSEWELVPVRRALSFLSRVVHARFQGPSGGCGCRFLFTPKSANFIPLAATVTAAMPVVDIFFFSETSEEENSQPIRKLFISK